MAYGFHHLTRDERWQIYALRKSGVKHYIGTGG